jgi:hypothetical protein
MFAVSAVAGLAFAVQQPSNSFIEAARNAAAAYQNYLPDYIAKCIMRVRERRDSFGRKNRQQHCGKFAGRPGAQLWSCATGFPFKVILAYTSLPWMAVTSPATVSTACQTTTESAECDSNRLARVAR